MRKPESTFTDSVHRHLVPEDALHREKMNNPYRGGTADWWYSGSVADLWVEYKYVERLPTRAGITPDVSSLQEKWLRRRYREGRNVAVIVGCPEGGVILLALSWEHEIPIDAFRERLMPRPEIAKWIMQYTLGRIPDGLPDQSRANRGRR